eukprot:TRINITY_DN40674_c0_g1_i1.p1 TRINITY_DN40674_c0_g1~~TRINITY_DN40674_c0_g1_i1.p1  ORF type:complete len:530 (+),score=104.78 TRINITY_DN40674_c0_g1_i1:77-1666(+)
MAERPAGVPEWPDVLSWLIADAEESTAGNREAALKAFLETSWEKQPRVCKASPSRRKVLGGITGRKHFTAIIKDLEADDIALNWADDVNAVKYTKAAGRITCNPAPESGDPKALVTLKNVWKLFDKQGCSFQFHQPQRFCDTLARLLFELECYFGCLVGSNTYMTPKGSQGLAPHFDDVEIFVIQTEGSKRWRLYKPVPGWELANKHSRDYKPSDLGQPTLEVVLQPGDVLYMPRGTPHEACCSEGDESFHVTVSTYQNWSLGDFAATTMQVALRTFTESLRVPQLLRPSMSAGAVFSLGTAGDHQSARRELLQAASRGLQEWSDRLLKEAEDNKEASLCARAIDCMSVDFMKARLPPPPERLPSAGTCPSSVRDMVRAVLPRVARAQLVNTDWAREEAQVQHCLKNCREKHMIAETEENDENSEEEDDEEADADEQADGNAGLLAFPSAAMPALKMLFHGNDSQWLCCGELPGLAPEEALGLCQQLWQDGLIATKESDEETAAAAKGKKRKAKASPKADGKATKKSRR